MNMNESQTIFTLFFAISWGIVSNVLPKWKPFHFAIFVKFSKARLRVLVSFAILNLFPWVVFVAVYGSLQQKELKAGEYHWLLLFRSILPGLFPFATYRLWFAIIQFAPTWFYATRQAEVPKDFQVLEKDRAPIEPDIDWLLLRPSGKWSNLLFAALYGIGALGVFL